eukprot:9289113-Pyramimonas_sp.AAC.1
MPSPTSTMCAPPPLRTPCLRHRSVPRTGVGLVQGTSAVHTELAPENPGCTTTLVTSILTSLSSAAAVAHTALVPRGPFVDRIVFVAICYRARHVHVVALSQAHKAGKRILVEGANATMLDINYGTYPYVTSSAPSIGGVIAGLGLSVDKFGDIIGVAKVRRRIGPS